MEQKRINIKEEAKKTAQEIIRLFLDEKKKEELIKELEE